MRGNISRLHHTSCCGAESDKINLDTSQEVSFRRGVDRENEQIHPQGTVS